MTDVLALLALVAVVACALLARFFARGRDPRMRALAIYFGMVGGLYLALFTFEALAAWPITSSYVRWRSLGFRSGHGLALLYLVVVLRANGR